MCASELDCGAQASCVAGRCVARGATAAIDSARRLLVEPVDVAYVRPGAGAAGSSIAVLGSRADGGSMILARFSVQLPPESNVLEAYLVLERATDVDADPGSVLLGTARIVDPWDSRTLSWARQPRLEEAGSPVTPAASWAGPLVRLDVRTIVQRWRRRVGDDFGIAVVAEGRSGAGVAFALSPRHRGRFDPVLAPEPPPSPQPLSALEPRPAPASAVAEPRAELVGPRLELYVK